MINSEIQSVATRGDSDKPLMEGAKGITATLMSKVFSSQAQGTLLAYPQLAYSEGSGRMTLATLVETYGRASIVSALQLAIMDIAQFVGGSPEPQTIVSVAGQCAGLIVSDFPGIKPSEVSLFCARFKRGDYGECYKFTGQAIMTAWGKFKKDRDQERFALWRAEQSEKTRRMLEDPAVVTDPAKIEEIAARVAGGAHG